jgi:hypothetical protein
MPLSVVRKKLESSRMDLREKFGGSGPDDGECYGSANSGIGWALSPLEFALDVEGVSAS